MFDHEAATVIPAKEIAPLCVDIRQAARLLGMSERTVWNLVGEGRLPYIQLGGKNGKIWFRVSSLDAWLAAQETTAPRKSVPRSSTPQPGEV